MSDAATVFHTSPFPFAETLDRLTRAIEGSGSAILARIDHAANARGAGLAMPPTTVLIYGNPRGGTPIMLAASASALDLPLRVLVSEDGGRVTIAFHPIAATLRQAGVPEALATRLDPAQALLVQALTP